MLCGFVLSYCGYTPPAQAIWHSSKNVIDKPLTKKNRTLFLWSVGLFPQRWIGWFDRGRPIASGQLWLRFEYHKKNNHLVRLYLVWLDVPHTGAFGLSAVSFPPRLPKPEPRFMPPALCHQSTPKSASQVVCQEKQVRYHCNSGLMCILLTCCR